MIRYQPASTWQCGTHCSLLKAMFGGSVHLARAEVQQLRHSRNASEDGLSRTLHLFRVRLNLGMQTEESGLQHIGKSIGREYFCKMLCKCP